MSTMVWDLPTDKIYETGVDRAVLFPMDGPGVPWNGLVSVSNDVSGGESEELYYDGKKYLDFVDVEAFQGTITAFGAPKEFAPCEGLIKDAAIPGMYIPFGRRSKFSVSWRTKIANESESTDFAYKLHLLYNAMVMPTPRTWQTLSDTTSPDSRSFTVKATPACARWSYVVFDSRECDLSLLEAQLYSGVLPPCGSLGDFVLPPPGGGGGGNPDAGCTYLEEDFESYYPAQQLDIDVINGDPVTEELIHGEINDGLEVQELVANGAFAANDSTATVVGTGAILADADDTTYIDGPNGDLGYTIALPKLVGYVEGASFELHIRLSISGGVSTDDPDGLVDADAQVFITTDAGGDTAVGGFSDGNDNSMSFVVQDVDGTIDDYVIPLDLSSWIDTSVNEVAAALAAGAYLNVVALNNNNYDTTPDTRVYEASVVMLDDTDATKSLRVIPGEDEAYIKQYVPNQASPDTNASTVTVDFLVKQKVMDTSGVTTATQPISDWSDLTAWPGTLAVELDGDNPILVWRDQTGTVAESLNLNLNNWYTASVYWTWGTIEVFVYDQGDPGTSYAHWTETITDAAVPTTFCAHKTGIVINGDVTYEVSLDNTTMQVHCHESAPLEPIEIDTTVTRIRFKRDDNDDGYHTDDFVDMTSSTTLDYYNYFGGPSGLTGTGAYIVEMDGHTFPSEDYFPAVPDGYVLSSVRPWVEAYLVNGPQAPVDGSGFGYYPNPTKLPWLQMQSTHFLTFEDFGTTYPPPRLACYADDDLSLFQPGGGGAGADLLANGGWSSHVHVIVCAFGYRFTYTPI